MYTNGAGAQPHWIINSNVYQPYPAVAGMKKLPPGHRIRSFSDGAELIISNVTPSLNGTSYQCRLQLSDSSSSTGTCYYYSLEGQQLIIIDCRGMND